MISDVKQEEEVASVYHTYHNSPHAQRGLAVEEESPFSLPHSTKCDNLSLISTKPLVNTSLYLFSGKT